LNFACGKTRDATSGGGASGEPVMREVFQGTRRPDTTFAAAAFAAAAFAAAAFAAAAFAAGFSPGGSAAAVA
jgi:hypothetical protein